MAAQQPARASPELRKAQLSPRYRRNYTTPRGTTVCSHFEVRKLRKSTGIVWRNTFLSRLTVGDFKLFRSHSFLPPKKSSPRKSTF